MLVTCHFANLECSCIILSFITLHINWNKVVKFLLFSYNGEKMNFKNLHELLDVTWQYKLQIFQRVSQAAMTTHCRTHSTESTYHAKKKKRKKLLLTFWKGKFQKCVATTTTSAHKLTIYFLSLSRVLSEQINKSMNLQNTEKNKCLKTEYFFVLNLKPGALNPQLSDLIWSQGRKQTNG